MKTRYKVMLIIAELILGYATACVIGGFLGVYKVPAEIPETPKSAISNLPLITYSGNMIQGAFGEMGIPTPSELTQLRKGPEEVEVPDSQLDPADEFFDYETPETDPAEEKDTSAEDAYFQYYVDGICLPEASFNAKYPYGAPDFSDPDPANWNYDPEALRQYVDDYSTPQYTKSDYIPDMWFNDYDHGDVGMVCMSEYIVQKGDSWWKIAENVYGKGSKSYTVARFNGMTIDTPLKQGMVLGLPTPGSLEELRESYRRLDGNNE